jgi:hypothetical protein
VPVLNVDDSIVEWSEIGMSKEDHDISIVRMIDYDLDEIYGWLWFFLYYLMIQVTNNGSRGDPL